MISLPPAAIVGSPGPSVGLSLSDAIACALAKNTDLALSESKKRLAGFQIVRLRGPFDVKLQVTPSFNETTIPPLSPFQAGAGGGPVTQLTTGLQSGLTATTQSGTQYALGLAMQRIESDSTSNSYDPYYPTALSFAVTEPLGRGQYTADRRDLDLAVATHGTESADALVTASQTIASVANCYWDLVAAWRNLGIQEEALRQIQAQAASNERQSRRGRMAPVEVIEANTQVDVYQENVFSAVQSVATLQNRLKSLLLANPLDPMWNLNLVPTTSPIEPPPEPQLKHLVMEALLRRPEVVALLAQEASAEVQRAYALDQAKPQIDLQLGYTASGFAGENGNIASNPFLSGFQPLFTSVNQLIGIADAALPGAQQLSTLPALAFSNPTNTTGRFGQSFHSLFANTYPTYTAQLNLSLPIRNDAAKGAMGVAEEQERQVQIAQTSLVQQIIFDARNAIQALETARARLQAAHAAHLAADRVLLGEERRFALGRSTTFLVLQREVEAANDQGRELQAQTDLNKAAVELDRVSGTIFERNGIKLTNAGNDEFPKLMKAAGLSQ